jgi:hypothetical protein
LCRPAHAVLKEANLDNTLSILRQELTYYYQDQQEQAESSKLMRQMVFQELMSIVRRSNQNALMLYSQKSDYVFDLTYACHEATEMYHNFRRMLLPFRNIVDKYENEMIAKVDGMSDSESVQTLSAFGVDNAVSLFKKWRDLDKYLLVKYIDGNIKRQNEDGSFMNNGFDDNIPEFPIQEDYSDKWKENVVRDNGDVLRIRK